MRRLRRTELVVREDLDDIAPDDHHHRCPNLRSVDPADEDC
jgi:hypothetical protein